MTTAGRRAGVVFNGRFLAAPLTGVQRVAAELIAAWSDLPEAAGTAGRVVAPKRAKAPDGWRGPPVEARGALVGVPWEQLELPGQVGRDELLVNLCNAGPLAGPAGLTMIHDAQTLEAPDSYSPAFRAWYGVSLRRLGAMSRRILTVSAFSRDRLAALGVAPAERIAVIHNGADHVRSRVAEPAALARLELEERPFFLALANVQPHKNIGLLLRAFARAELATARLVLYGGADRAAFEAAGHAPPANVTFAGRVTDGELVALLRRATALLFPSTTEGFGLPPVEALLTGCPVVAAPRGALPEVLGDAAEFRPADSPEAWAAAAAALTQESAEARSARISHGERFAARYTWRAAAWRLQAEIAAAQSAPPMSAQGGPT
jgi:glycosyltransferase involved in cell wall biosynthesis